MTNPYLFILQEIKSLEKKIKEIQDYKEWKIQQVCENFDDSIEEKRSELIELKKSVECTHENDEGKSEIEYSQDPGSGHSEHYCCICQNHW